MAIYRIFPEKDTTIYSELPTSNSGKDEIIEIGGYLGTNTQTGETARILLKFSDQSIVDVIENKVGLDATGSMSASIKMYLGDASELPVDYTLFAYPIQIPGEKEWDNGTGKSGDNPLNTSGVSWINIASGNQIPWATSYFPLNTTASFVAGKGGGGTWLTASNDESMEFSQNHPINSTHDVDINITPAIKQIYDFLLYNKGFIIKLEDQYEFYTSSSIRLKYFGIDTNTIYPPFLEIGWDDSEFAPGGLSTLSTDIATIHIKNNKGKYPDIGKQRFRITARPTYPVRAFTTSSIYLNNQVLPSASFWGLRDENTEEMVVDFNQEFTKISCDSTGSFFDVYMDGLQPERYYRILVKTEVDSSTVVIDNQNIFKVVRNG